MFPVLLKKFNFDFLWLSLALLIVLALAFLLPLAPQDFWWYLRVGRETVLAGSVPTIDTYSIPRAGTPLTYPAWLAAVFLWITYDFGSIPLTFLLRGLIMAIAYGLIWLTMRRFSGPRLATLLTIVLTLSSSSNWSVRPQMFVFPAFAFLLWSLYRWQENEPKYLWWLPLMTMFWANIHSSFVMIFLLGLPALLFGKGPRRPIILGLSLSVVAAMLNPVGANIWWTVLDAGSIRSISAEWLPPANTGWQMNIFFGWLLLFIPLAVFSARKLSAMEWLWFLGLGWLALSGIRFVLWFQILIAVQSAFLLADWDKRWLDRRNHIGLPVVNILLGLIFLLFPLSLVTGFRERWWAQSPPALEETPLEAVEWLQQHPELPGPMWNDFNFSSYLIFALPQRPVWIDTRMHLVGYTPEQYDQYRAIANARYDWENLLLSDGINLLFLSTQNQPILAQAVEQSPNWCIAYRDESSLIAARVDSNQPCP